MYFIVSYVGRTHALLVSYTTYYIADTVNVENKSVSATLRLKKATIKTQGKPDLAMVCGWQNVYLGDSCDRDGNTLARVNVIAGNL